jgi:hypothetical protein
MNSHDTSVVVEGPDGPIRLSPPAFTEQAQIFKKLFGEPSDLSGFGRKDDGRYGLNQDGVNPFKLADECEPAGGVVFFGTCTEEDFVALLRLLDIRVNAREYWLYHMESDEPGEDGYLEQVRVVDRFGLKYLFRVLKDEGYDQFPQQPVTLSEILWAFICDQNLKWGDGNGYSDELADMFDEDGDDSKRQLSFGVMVENSYHKVYRIWSRAWLVTK